jgi:hypothetical protein
MVAIAGLGDGGIAPKIPALRHTQATFTPQNVTLRVIQTNSKRGTS